MKYFIRFMASIPSLGSGASCVILFAFMFDNHFLVLPLIGNLLGFIYLLDKYEDTVLETEELVNILLSRYEKSV